MMTKFTRAILTAALLVTGLSAYAQPGTKTYIVQLADAPVATYDGRVAGLAPTRPAVGAKIDMASSPVRAYVGYLSRQRAKEIARVGSASVVHRYGYAFNGFAAKLTDAQAMALKTSPNVLSVTESDIRKMDTTTTPAFLGISKPGGLWSQLDANAQNVKGENVIIGVIDSGVWPENPSFGDKIDTATSKPLAYFQGGTPVYGAAPAKWHGVCQTGEGFTASMCNHKLLGARYYVAGFDAGGGTLSSFEYRSPRSGGGDGGHGTHTASTAGGNSNVDAAIDGVPVGSMSGIAPRARLAVYKICWQATATAQTGCYTADTLKAIDDAVADGVDVINFSVSGTQTNFVDPVEIAYLNATAAGVFVAASAGNSGPANTVAHISPWLTTVAASTHDRKTIGDVTLGDGSVFTGASTSQMAVTASLVLSSSIPAAGVAVADANLCFLNSLDIALAAGKIVICDRGTNARVEKSQEVLRVGGVGMILINPTDNGLVADFHVVPTVHLQNTDRTAVRTYATTSGATATISHSYLALGVIAPVMASFSSRGPSLANGNVLKPDITGPGVDVIAAWGDNSLTQAQHDALLNNNFTPKANANQISGTSMSSPHVAGSAALLKQLHPTWTPAAIKSALMTTTNGVKLADGTPDLARFGYGAGHLNPNPAGDPGLVYDIAPADYGRFLCGLGLAPPAGIGTCGALGSVQPWNLNLASITATGVVGMLNLTRTVKNVGNATSTYVSNATLPGWTVSVTPPSLTLAPGASASYNVAITRTSAALNTWTFGNLVWNDNVHTVTSPLSASAAGFVAPAEVSDVRATGRGTKVYQIISTYTGSMSVSAIGLVPATRTTNTVQAGQTQCVDVVVPAGAQVARFQLFNADTQGGSATDLDLNVFSGSGGTGSLVGSSGGSTSDEIVTLRSPAAHVYSACVTGYTTPAGGAQYTLSTWVVGPAVGAQTMRVSGPASVYAGGSASIALGWSVPAGVRYLGNVSYTDPASATLGSTIVFVDNH